MSAFDDMIEAGMEDFESITGSTSFTMDGKSYAGSLNEYEGEQEVDLDGVMGMYNATLVCQKPQFRLIAKPLHKTLNGKTLALDGVSYKVARVAVDSASVTLGLRIAR